MASSTSAFHWEPGEAPPPIEEHSLAKLQVLRRYLRAYFDRLNQDVRRDHFRLALVDGFAGGGLYLHNGQEESGSPLVMLEESKSAERRLNEGRRKPLQFDVKHHFVESDPAHAEYLRRVLEERGHLENGKGVMLYPERRLADVLDQIIAAVAPTRGHSGRSIFLLDQCGYTDADINLVRRIGDRLPNAEVILTVSFDAMLNFSNRDNLVSRISSFGINRDRVEALLHTSEDHPKALMQRALPMLVVDSTVFHWFTPFFLRPKKSRRDLWFVYFSRNATARDVMLDCHWKSRNAFAHYGESFGLKMLGFEALEGSTVPLLTFNDGDREEMNAALAEQLVRQLHGKLKTGGLRLSGVLDHFGNKAAATIADFNNLVVSARNAGELQVVGPDGRPRSRSLQIIRQDDRIVLPLQLTLPLGKR